MSDRNEGILITNQNKIYNNDLVKINRAFSKYRKKIRITVSKPDNHNVKTSRKHADKIDDTFRVD